MNRPGASVGRALLASALMVLLVPAVVPEGLDAQGPPQFEEVADQAGLHYRDETCGFAWGDYDGDGYLDLFLGHHPVLTEVDQDRDSALMRNNGDGTFTNVIYGSGILLQEDRHDAAWIDFDNDGDLDLWVSVGGRGGGGEGPSQLYRNDGGGQFVDVAPAAGVDYPRGRGRGTAWLDFDSDGDLDLFFTGAKLDEAPNAFFRNEGDGSFTNITDQLGLDPFLGAMSNVAVADYDGDGDQDMFVTGYSTRLYRNNGDGTFTEAPAQAGVRTTGATSAAWGDYDNDGLMDLYVARAGQVPLRDYQEWTPSQVLFVMRLEEADVEDGMDILTVAGTDLSFELQNRIGGITVRNPAYVYIGSEGYQPASTTFTLSGAETSGPPQYVAGEVRGYFIWQSEPGLWHVRCSALEGEAPEACQGIITAPGGIVGVTEVGFEPVTPEYMPDQLFRNLGDGIFEDVTSQAGLGDGRGCYSPTWGDYDNDGFLDLYVQVLGPMEGDEPNLLYRNNGDGTFTNVAASAGVEGTTQGQAWGALWADYDNDGFLDLLANQESWWWPLAKGRYELYHNQGNGNHWFKVELRGVQSNARGHGAKLWLSVGGNTQFREVGDNSHYFQHYAGPVHFGLGSAIVVEELRILWPSGVSQILTDVAADQQITVIEGLDQPTSTPSPTATATATATPTPTATGTATATATATGTATATATHTPTSTATATPTPGPSVTAAVGATVTPTSIPTSAPTVAQTSTGAPTAEPAATATPEPTVTVTPGPGAQEPVYETSLPAVFLRRGGTTFAGE
ncbi:MAG: CRTAC1 family protein [Anaerolineae bacterium]|nr:CRTAC1 family protein [Anaerolineae bacterium]